jgi:DNA polymerase-4
MSRAVRLCPALVIVRPDFQKYRAVSQQVFEIFRSVTPLVEPMSLDEAYLDVTANAWDEPLAVNVAKRIKAAIREKTQLTASAGVAPNKFLAKIASGWKKPDGLTVIAPERVERFLTDLPVDALWGVGPKTAEKLRQHGIHKLVDVRARPLEDLQAVVGSLAGWLVELSYGRDDRAVEPDRAVKSAGSECTYPEDLIDRARIRSEIDGMARDLAAWLGRKALFARTVTIKVRYEDFTTITRSQSAPLATQESDAIAARACALLDRTEAGARPVRLLGVSLHNFSETPSPPEPAEPEPEPPLPFD